MSHPGACVYGATSGPVQRVRKLQAVRHCIWTIYTLIKNIEEDSTFFKQYMRTRGYSFRLCIQLKSTEVQTLGAVALHATTACTDKASIFGLGPLNWAIV